MLAQPARWEFQVNSRFTPMKNNHKSGAEEPGQQIHQLVAALAR